MPGPHRAWHEISWHPRAVCVYQDALLVDLGLSSALSWNRDCPTKYVWGHRISVSYDDDHRHQSPFLNGLAVSPVSSCRRSSRSCSSYSAVAGCSIRSVPGCSHHNRLRKAFRTSPCRLCSIWLVRSIDSSHPSAGCNADSRKSSCTNPCNCNSPGCCPRMLCSGQFPDSAGSCKAFPASFCISGSNPERWSRKFCK